MKTAQQHHEGPKKATILVEMDAASRHEMETFRRDARYVLRRMDLERLTADRGLADLTLSEIAARMRCGRGAVRPRTRGERKATSRRRPRVAAGDSPERPRPDLEPRPCLCGCGDFTPARRDQNCRTPACRVRWHRVRKLEARDELLERARLARVAVRKGADPLSALTLVVWPPDTAEEARRLLEVAA